MSVVMNKRLLDLKSAAEYLSIGITTLKSWIRAERIKSIKINSRRLLDVNELDEFIEDLKKEQRKV